MKTARRISKLIIDVQRDLHGTGIGKPERRHQASLAVCMAVQRVVTRVGRNPRPPSPISVLCLDPPVTMIKVTDDS
jgi:hypothetical protein